MVYNKRSEAQRLLFYYLGLTALLVVIGFVFIYSSSSVYALERMGSPAYFLKKQVIASVLGLIAAGACFLVPTRMVRRLSRWSFFGALCVTTLSLVSGFAMRIHGSSRWIGYGGFSFQPSELLKYALILFVSSVLVNELTKKSQRSIGYGYILGALALCAIVLLKQPDFGLLMTLLATVLILMFIVCLPLKQLIWLIGAAIPAVIFLILREPYRIRRLLVYMNPWDDPQGSGFQIIQSLIAVGSGGMWGLGIGHSQQKFFYLPMQHTDFIFSIIAEETGLVGGVIVVSLFVAHLYIGMKLAWQFTDRFATYVTLGFALLISLQAVINLSVTIGLFPTKGIGLPFVSYGNSALVCSLAMFGIIARFVREESQSVGSRG